MAKQKRPRVDETVYDDLIGVTRITAILVDGSVRTDGHKSPIKITPAAKGEPWKWDFQGYAEQGA